MYISERTIPKGNQNITQKLNVFDLLHKKYYEDKKPVNSKIPNTRAITAQKTVSGAISVTNSLPLLSFMVYL
jgi:hypothetical protein